jgi:sulfoxide reductase heme-binding subunit YedZ
MLNLKPLVIPTSTAAIVAMCGGILLLGENSEESARMAVRVTAASSFLLLCLAFSARAAREQLGNIWLPVLQARRRIGISFAISHTIHLFTIINLVQVAYAGDYSKLGPLAGGAAVYLIIYAMAFTSNDASVRLLGAKIWRRFHTVGGYLLLLVFTGQYLGSYMEKGGYYWLYLALGLAVLVLRQLYRFKKV